MGINRHLNYIILLGGFFCLSCGNIKNDSIKQGNTEQLNVVNDSLKGPMDFNAFYDSFYSNFIDGKSILPQVADSLSTRGGLDFYPVIVYESDDERLLVVQEFFKQELGMSLDDSNFNSALKTNFDKWNKNYENLKHKNDDVDYQRRGDMVFTRVKSRWYLNFLYLDDQTIKILDSSFGKGGIPDEFKD